MRATQYAVSLLLPLCLVLLLGCAHTASLSSSSAARVDASGLQDAVAVATVAIQGQAQLLADNYTVTSAQQLLVKNRYVWRIAFKPSPLLPADPSKLAIGAGGEIFVNVDPMTKGTEIRFGE